MQPEPTEASTASSTLPITSDRVNVSQYGFPTDNLPAAGLSVSPPEGRAAPGGSPTTRLPSDTRPSSPLPRLNLNDESGNRPKPSFKRISEYEKALSPSPPKRHNHGPGFIVMKKAESTSRGPQLANFPNEVLTHILSHLPASSLSAMSYVCHRFRELVTTPHAWRVAFARFFPGQDNPESLSIVSHNRRVADNETQDELRSEQRFFTRLNALASWRSEYMLRTKLLRSLEKGKPSQLAQGYGPSSRSGGSANNTSAVMTYNSQMFATVNHIHAIFPSGQMAPRFMHGSDELGTACISDPNTGKVDNWGLTDPQMFSQFAELDVGEQPYGYGDGPTGLPNCMDLSQLFGMVYGEGFPGGRAFFRTTGEMSGRFLNNPWNESNYPLGIPKKPLHCNAISSVWVAKTSSILSATDGLIGILTGSTLGIINAYSLGTGTSKERRTYKRMLTATWVVCPGVPIISIKVDDSYNPQRKASGRIWAVALNALGEVFYLTETPVSVIHGAGIDDDSDWHYWDTGRTVHWTLAEPSRRVARDDPYHEFEIPGSYSPRSSSKKMDLSSAQLAAEAREIEKFFAYRPSHFRKICKGWDMLRKLEVDFGGDDGKSAGEAIFLITCGGQEEQHAEIRRLTRVTYDLVSTTNYPIPKTPPMVPVSRPMASLFGGSRVITPARSTALESSLSTSTLRGSSVVDRAGTSLPDSSPSLPASPAARDMVSSTISEEWRSSILSLKEFPGVEITTSAIDMSIPALLTADEDPLLTMNGASHASTPFATPSDEGFETVTSIPGHRSRLLAIGTKTGIVVMWNMRGPQPENADIVNELRPQRAIYTDSPEISCLAVSALCVVHGGNDGLVQAWDPLASTLLPIRTLNSRFSSRARRRLIQAAASVQGVGVNLYAAGTIVLDPDPAVLRGMVSLGTHLRYWSYSSSSADQYQSKKRRLRKSGERGSNGSNGSSDRFTPSGREALRNYIEEEQDELRNERRRRERQDARLRERFGVGFGDLSEEEAVRYAQMISAETFQRDEERRSVDPGYVTDLSEPSRVQSAWSSSATATPEGSVRGRIRSPTQSTDDQFDHDLDEAIRLSLLDGVDSGGRSPKANGSGEYDIPIKYKQKKKKGRRSASSSTSSSQASNTRKMLVASGSTTRGVAADDLDFALQLSLAEERSKSEQVQEEAGSLPDQFPSLETPASGKGKERAR